MSAPFFSVQDLSAGYGGRPVLQNLSFSLPAGSLTALLGVNGCGKTTLLKAICGQLKHQGSCVLNSVPLESMSPRRLAQAISYIPQRSGVTISLAILDVVLMGFNPQLNLLQRPSAAQRQHALDAIRQVGLGGLEDTDYQTLSEGQKQLCILARTLIEDTSLLLLDEPDSSLDFTNRYEILRMIKSITRSEKTAPETPARSALLCLHDPNLAFAFCDRILLLQKGGGLLTLLPQEDSVASMEEKLCKVFGRVSLVSCAAPGGKPSLVMLA